MSSVISSLNAGSGIDTQALIDGLVAAERAPVEERLDKKQETLDAQISGYGAMKSALSDLQALIKPLSDNDTFSARAVSFPDTDLITPNSIAAGAQPGNYQIEVEKTARQQTLALETASAANETLGLSGNLTIQFGNWSYTDDSPSPDIPTTFTLNTSRDAFTIEVDANDSLQSIADKINAENSGAQASVIKIDDQYQLSISSPSGESNALRISSDNTASLGVLEFNETQYADVLETQQAQNAQVVVNGITVTRETNELTDVIDGFDFTLNKANDGEVLSFTIEEDKVVAEQAIRDMVEGYNLFYTTAKALTGYSRDEDNNLVKGDLATDSTAKSLLSRIRESIGAQVGGLDNGFNALTYLGIKTELDGSLTINETEFKSAVSNNFDKFEALFSPQTTSASSRVLVGQGSRIDFTPTGDYQVEVTQDATKGSLNGNVLGGGAPSFPLNAGLTDVTESTAVGFTALLDGESVTVAGLTLTAGSGGLDADSVASAFASLADGSTEGAGVANGVPANASWTGTLTGFASGSASGASVTFTSSISNQDVTDLVASSTATAAGAPSINTTTDAVDGVTGVYTFDLTGTVLNTGDGLSVGGVSFAYTAAGESTAAAAIAAGIDGETISIGGIDYQVDATDPAAVTLTQTVASDNAVGDLVLAAVDSGGTAPTDPASTAVTQTAQGVTQTTEVAEVTFSDLSAGDSITVDGLTFTANQAILAADVAAAFSNLAASSTPADIAGGAFTGATSANFTSGAAAGALVTYTAVSSGAISDVVSSASSSSGGLTLSTIDGSSEANYRFTIEVDGTASAEISLTGTYADADAVAAELESLINADPNLAERGAQVDVTFNSATNQFEFLNRNYGSSSTIAFLTASDDMAGLGITTSLVGTDGVDVEGSIGGVEAFGVGQVLLPDIESAAYGLTFTALEGAATEGQFTVSFSRGIGGELYRLMTEFLASDGTIATREDRIEDQLDEVSEDRSDLDKRIEAYQDRITAQFIVMEQIIISLQRTGDSLVGLADRLPFTANNR